MVDCFRYSYFFQIIQKLKIKSSITFIQVSLELSIRHLKLVNSFINSVTSVITITNINHLSSKQISFKLSQMVLSKRVVTRETFDQQNFINYQFEQHLLIVNQPKNHLTFQKHIFNQHEAHSIFFQSNLKFVFHSLSDIFISTQVCNLK